MRISCVARNAWWNEIVKIEMNEQSIVKTCVSSGFV